MSAELVAQLRDIHLPPEPPAWPPAPAAWLSIPLAAAVLIVWAVRRRRARSLRGQVGRELRRIGRAHAARPDAALLLAELAGLLRRGALAVFGPETAGLTGADWATFLWRHAPPGCDPRAWQLIALGRYLPAQPEFEAAALLAASRRWLDHVLP